MKSFLFVSVLLLLSGMCFAASQTSSFQCLHGIVSVGDTLGEVAAKCGQPSGTIETTIYPLTGSDAYQERKSKTFQSHWTYDPGPNGFIYRVEFRAGKVRYIENTERYGTR
jgi:hypothetical protein